MRRLTAIDFCGRRLLCLALMAVSVQPEAAEPLTPTSQEIRFESAGVRLAGTFVRPERPRAAVVIVHGSGQEQRNTEFAALLAQNGIAALTFDKRGVGESGGVYAGPEVGTNNVDATNLERLAADLRAAINALAARLPATMPIGLLGGSQAGWTIPLAAKQNGVVAFMVIFSGPVVTAREQLRFQFFTQGDRAFWETHSEAEARQHIRDDPDRYQFPNTDPRETLAQLSIPGLWLFGGKDIQAPVQLSIERLDTLRTQGKRYDHQLFPTLGHNVAFAKSSESAAAVAGAMQWIKTVADAPQPKVDHTD